MGIMKRLNPDNPAYKGCHIYTADDGTITYYVKRRGKFMKVGDKGQRGITPVYVKQFRDQLVLNERTNKILPINYQQKEKVITLNEAWDLYWEWAQVNHKPSTRGSHKSRYIHHIQPHLGNYPLDKIQGMDIEDCKKAWTKAGIPEQTQQQIWTTISTIFATMKKLNVYWGHRPLNDAEAINAKVKRDRFLTEQETEDLLNQLRGINIKTYLQACLAAYGSFRLNETMKLTPKDIDWNLGIITIRNVKHRKKKTKTRYIHFKDDPYLQSTLLQIKEMFPRKPNESFFTSFNRRAYNKAINNLEMNNGIDPRDQENRVGFHTLRHSYASQFLEAGGSLKELQNALGHDRIESTMIYAHIADKVAQKAQAKLAKHRAEVLDDKPILRIINEGSQNNKNLTPETAPYLSSL